VWTVVSTPGRGAARAKLVAEIAGGLSKDAWPRRRSQPGWPGKGHESLLGNPHPWLRAAEPPLGANSRVSGLGRILPTARRRVCHNCAPGVVVLYS
jgi:hypothetical protein